MASDRKLELDPSILDGWYHTMELAPGVVTNGLYDLRPYVRYAGLPENMEGMRALDVGTQDGFWAVEMERRGARVVGLNHPIRGQDVPPRGRHLSPGWPNQTTKLQLTKAFLGSNVDHVSINVTDRAIEDLGMFDVVFVSTVLLHVSDPLAALERLAGVCRGMLILLEPYDLLLSALPIPVGRYRGHFMERRKLPGSELELFWWAYWLPNLNAWKRLIWTAGFEGVRRHSRFNLRSTWGFKGRIVVHHAFCHPGQLPEETNPA